MSARGASRRARALVPGSDRGADSSAPAIASLVSAVTVRVRRVWASLGRAGDDEAAHAELLEGIARSLRGGASLTQAIGEVGRTSASDAGRSLGSVARRLERGASVTVSVERWIVIAPTPARRIAGAALALGSELGGAQARALDGAASGLRDRAAMRREAWALTAQARSSGAVLALAPIGFAAFAWTTDGRVAHVVLGTPLGWACLAGGVVLDLLGAAWMSRLTAGAV
jgi:tight adherence protein B